MTPDQAAPPRRRRERRARRHQQLVGADTAVLEWQTVGEAADGRHVGYHGLSVLKLDGERISGLRAYFDPAALAHRAAA